MVRYRAAVLAVLVFGLVSADRAAGQWKAGRHLEDGPAFSVGVSAGLVLGLDGEVRETERPLYAYTDDHSGSPPESYSWEELGFDDRYDTFGLFLERRGRFTTWLLDVAHGRTRVSGRADRDYFIGVERVSYRGRDYEHMQIPAGQSFRGEIDAYTLALSARITPVSWRGSYGGGFTPWLHLGLFGFAGDYFIDAGEPRGVIAYERPPRDYVVGGRGTGLAGILVPEVGLGGEVDLALGPSSRISLRGFAALMNLRANSGWFGVGARNEKVVDVDYRTYGGRIQFEQRLNRGIDFFAGMEVVYRTGTAEVRAKEREAEEVLSRREKFDKEAHFEMTAATVFLGIRF